MTDETQPVRDVRKLSAAEYKAAVKELLQEAVESPVKLRNERDLAAAEAKYKNKDAAK